MPRLPAPAARLALEELSRLHAKHVTQGVEELRVEHLHAAILPHETVRRGHANAPLGPLGKSVGREPMLFEELCKAESERHGCCL